MTKTRRLTTAQALLAFLGQQRVERDGNSHPFFAGCFGIFGHGNVAGLGEALAAAGTKSAIPYLPARNEQAMVHAAVAYAKRSFRKRALACTTSIGPGATNLVTGAAGATINRLPVLLLPGDVFATRQVDPVLQQLESASTRDVSVNDCLRPVSRYWDRIWRPEQLPSALMDAMRVLTSPVDTGAVTLCLPQDVQAEAFDFPEQLFAPRVWSIPRQPPEPSALQRATELVKNAARPLIVAGGGVLYSEATEALAEFAAATGIPVAETQAGKGAVPWDQSQAVGAIGVTGGTAANHLARHADLVIGIGTRYSDFTTQSQTAFQAEGVRFLNINVASFDGIKQGGLPLVADARAALDELARALAGFSVAADYAAEVTRLKSDWDSEVERVVAPRTSGDLGQAEVLGVLASVLKPGDVIVAAAGSLPGDLHKLWRSHVPGDYHLEYGYSCMGYEIAGALGAKMAAPDANVWALVGDGSYLMMAQELVTAVQEGIAIKVLLIDNHGYSSIGGLSQSVGCAGFGTRYRVRSSTGELDGEHLPIDFAANAASLGVSARCVSGRDDLRAELERAAASEETAVVVVSTDGELRVDSYDSWWDVPPAEVSSLEAVREARAGWDLQRKRRRFHGGGEPK